MGVPNEGNHRSTCIYFLRATSIFENYRANTVTHSHTHILYWEDALDVTNHEFLNSLLLRLKIATLRLASLQSCDWQFAREPEERMGNVEMVALMKEKHIPFFPPLA
jgi:hypothetical protein